jgi:septal ring factor EnvC (AmiA/AmiB activator)
LGNEADLEKYRKYMEIKAVLVKLGAPLKQETQRTTAKSVAIHCQSNSYEKGHSVVSCSNTLMPAASHHCIKMGCSESKKDEGIDEAKQEARLASMETSLEGQKKSLDGQKTSLENLKTSMEGQKKSLADQKTCLNGQKTSLENLQMSLEDQKTSLENLQMSLEDQKTSLEDLKTRHEAGIQEILSTLQGVPVQRRVVPAGGLI